MTVRRFLWACALGATVSTGSLFASEPAPINLPTPSSNQALANTIVGQLRQSAVLKSYTVDVNVQGGSVGVTGSVTDLAQKDEVLRLVQGVPGVVRVLDHLTVGNSGKELVKVQGPGLPEPSVGGGAGGKVIEGKGSDRKGGNAPLPEPVPMFGGGIPGGAEQSPPNLPPHAWPTYAPYNNFSRVGTPEAYPYQSWPFIGPVYPFPKVPLGWRKVQLEFDDGYWWYGQVGNKYNWWKIRYW